MLTRYEILQMLDRLMFVYSAVQLQKEYIKQKPGLKETGSLETALSQAAAICGEAGRR